MNPCNLHTGLAILLAVTSMACGDVASPADDGRDESFMAIMAADDGKADRLRVVEGSPDALAVLDVANTLTFRALEADVGLDRRVVAHLITTRDRDAVDPDDDNPFATLQELDDVPWTGMREFTLLWEFAHREGYVDAIRRPRHCAADADCGTGFCHVDRCYDVTERELDVTGELTFDVARDGAWWVRAHAGGSTVRETRGDRLRTEVDTSSYPTSDLDSWLARLPDGSLSTVTRSAQQVVPEFGPTADLNTFKHAIDAAYDAHGHLYVAAEARDATGAARGLVVLRQGEEAWHEEFKHSLDTPSDDTRLRTRFVQSSDGELQLWVDVDHAARRFDRNEDGRWREAMVIDMVEAGFGDTATSRTVHFHEGADGRVFIHRATWQFARRQQVIRIEANMVTAVVDLPTAARTIAPQSGGGFSVVFADGSLGSQLDGPERRGTSTPFQPPSPTDTFRAHGDDIYALQGSTLLILRARD